MRQLTVLVIEDEPIIRMFIADELVKAGFDVLEADNADEAFKLLAQQAEVHAIFTDVDMPGEINGLDLAWIVRERWPFTCILITSGHRKLGLTEIPQHAVFFPKPYTPTAVIRALEDATRRP